MAKRRLIVGCALMLLANAVGVAVLAFLALRAGMIFPTSCAANASFDDCAAIHAGQALPVYVVFWVIVLGNIGAVWRHMTARQ
ncbi:hypothetical protein [Terricaulis sp.]|uniref:hypothetical protein n=1 Tax=Terricaulis sp. TaxID=2768686 RepID=UPI002AC4E22F|nr:hypothetical protein [Terricaulis sp.]MDZ4690399.1 hypothetical protein [Terricaulis sp.]